MYKIKDYTKQKAKLLGVKVIPSTHKNKKIDVLDYHNNFICSIGDIRYKDFPTYLEENGKEYANKRRELYKIRHKKDRSIIGSCGYYADKLLW
jgi:hypothetical protein